MEDPAVALIGMLTGVFGLFCLAFYVISIIGMWKAFEKANQPGWASLIPIYNIVILLEIGGAPLWWLAIMLFVPLGNLVVTVILMMKIARSFGQGEGFGLGLAFLGSIFWIILGFGDSKYHGPAS